MITNVQIIVTVNVSQMASRLSNFGKIIHLKLIYFPNAVSRRIRRWLNIFLSIHNSKFLYVLWTIAYVNGQGYSHANKILQTISRYHASLYISLIVTSKLTQDPNQSKFKFNVVWPKSNSNSNGLCYWEITVNSKPKRNLSSNLKKYNISPT